MSDMNTHEAHVRTRHPRHRAPEPDPQAEAARQGGTRQAASPSARRSSSTSTATAASAHAAARRPRWRRTRSRGIRTSRRWASIRSTAAGHRRRRRCSRHGVPQRRLRPHRPRRCQRRAPWPRACRALPLASPPKWRVAKEAGRRRTSMSLSPTVRQRPELHHGQLDRRAYQLQLRLADQRQRRRHRRCNLQRAGR